MIENTKEGVSARLEDKNCYPTEEGRRSRRKKEEGRNNPHLALSRRNDPTCLIFSDCLLGVWRVYGNCLEVVWRVSRGYLEVVLRVSGRNLWDI